MKKVISLILALALVMSMSITAFAADTSANVSESGKSATINVSGTYNKGGIAATRVSVDITWDAMTFTYTGASDGTWDPATHSYTGSSEGGWSTETATITVTNHSNAAITATCSFAATATGVVGKFDGETTKTLNVESADADKYRTAAEDGVYPAPSASTEFGISGAAIDANTALGTITVAIATATATN